MNAYIKLTMIITVPLKATELDAALTEARSLKESKLITFKKGVEYSDGQMEVVGVQEDWDVGS